MRCMCKHNPSVSYMKQVVYWLYGSCQVEELLEFLHRVFGAGDGMPNCAGIAEDLVVVSSLHRRPSSALILYLFLYSHLVCLVAKEVDLLPAIVFDMIKSKSLVPTSREDIE